MLASTDVPMDRVKGPGQRNLNIQQPSGDVEVVPDRQVATPVLIVLSIRK
jgi:hypothetical protein